MVKIEIDSEKAEDREFVRRMMKWYDDNPIPSVSSSASPTMQTNIDEGVDMATPGQIKYLRGLNYDGDPSKLSKKDASAKIKELGGN